MKRNFLYQRLKPGLTDRYLFGQSITPFIISLSVVLIAMLLERLLLLFNLLADEFNPFSSFLNMLTDLIPHYLGLALPSALCVSIFSVVRRLSVNNEIDAFMSSGISLLQIARPFIIAGILLGGVSYMLYGYLQPYARYDYRAAFYLASHSGWVPHLQTRMIVKPTANLMLTADEVTNHGSDLKGVFIQDNSETAKGNVIERSITAQRGRIILAADRSKVELDLYDGKIITIEAGKNPTLTSFGHTTKILSQRGHLPAFRNRGDDERELTLKELKHNLRVPQTSISPAYLRSEYHFRLVRAFSIPFIPLLATALAIMGKRQRSNSGLVLAALILVAYDNLLQFGASMISTGKHGPFLVIWLPFIFFSLGSVYLLSQRSGSWFHPSFIFKRHYRPSPSSSTETPP